MGPIGCSETSVTVNLRCVTSQKNEDLNYIAAAAWNNARIRLFMATSSTNTIHTAMFTMKTNQIRKVKPVSTLELLLVRVQSATELHDLTVGDLPLASTPSGAEYWVSLISCLARCNKYSLMWSVTTSLPNSWQERDAITEFVTQKCTALKGTYVQNINYRTTAQFSKIYTTYPLIPTLNIINVATVHTFTRSSLWSRLFPLVFPCFFLSCKANARVYLAKTGHGPHSS
jgi:hypothetical protein